MKTVLAILAIVTMFSMFIAADNHERKLYTIAYISTIIGMVVLVAMEFIKVWLL